MSDEIYLDVDPGDGIVVVIWDDEIQTHWTTSRFDGKWQGEDWDIWSKRVKPVSWFMIDDAHPFLKPKPLPPPPPDPTDVIIWYWSNNEEVNADIWFDEQKKVMAGYKIYKPRPDGDIKVGAGFEDDPEILAKVAWDRWRHGDDLPPGDHRARVFVAKQPIYEIVKDKNDNS